MNEGLRENTQEVMEECRTCPADRSIDIDRSSECLQMKTLESGAIASKDTRADAVYSFLDGLKKPQREVQTRIVLLQLVHFYSFLSGVLLELLFYHILPIDFKMVPAEASRFLDAP